MNQQQTSDALRQERTALMGYLWELPEAAWEKPSLCEDWCVRDVVAHLVGNAADINALNLEGAGTPEFNQRQLDERKDKTPAELLVEWEEQGTQFEAGVASFADDFWNSDFPPFGTVGTALRRIVEDIYIHAQDIRIALGEEQSDGPGLIPTLEVLAQELPERAARLIPDIGAIEFDVDGFKRTVALGDGAKKSIRVTGDPKALAFVATGRTPLDRAVADGTINVTPEVSSGLGDALNFYGP